MARGACPLGQMSDEIAHYREHSQYRKFAVTRHSWLVQFFLGYVTSREGPFMLMPAIRIRYVVLILATGASALGFFALSMLLATPVMA